MKSANWMEEIQDYLNAATQISYTSATDLFIGQIFSFDDILTAPSLTLYEEGSEITFGRINKQQRNLRFAFKDTSYETVMSNNHSVYEFMIKNRIISSTHYKSSVNIVFRTPSLVDVYRSNIYISDFVLGFIVTAN